ncbi:hypothetical protein EDD86DRAFT_248347 [Gorgonomyces haynaldii]|nr:hypothetical protein EDD86DRAFT_248347 [Gorgonomyces haynaldii]
MVKVVIIGGGASGYRVARDFAKQKDIEVTLIEKQKEWYMPFAGTRAMVDAEFGRKSYISYATFFKSDSPHKVVNATVTQVDKNQVTVDGGAQYPFDYLVIASGVSYGLPIHVREQTPEQGVAVLSKNADAIKAANKIVVVGGGPIGIETASEIKHKYPEKQVTVVTAAPQILVMDGVKERLQKTVRAEIEKLGIKIITNARVQVPEDRKDVNPWTGEHVVKTAEGTEIPSDYTLLALGIGKPNTSFVTLPELLNEKKYVAVNSNLHNPTYKNIFALGDVATTGGPRTAVATGDQVTVIVQNILASIARKPLKEYKPKPDPMIAITLNEKQAIGQMQG